MSVHIMAGTKMTSFSSPRHGRIYGPFWRSGRSGHPLDLSPDASTLREVHRLYRTTRTTRTGNGRWHHHWCPALLRFSLAPFWKARDREHGSLGHIPLVKLLAPISIYLSWFVTGPLRSFVLGARVNSSTGHQEPRLSPC